MKQIFKDLLDAKQKMYEIQNFFAKTLKERYPSLMIQSVDDLEGKTNKELDFLLSSTVRIKSGRIVISAPEFGYKNELILTRNPSLKHPHGSYGAFSFTNVKEIIKNGDLIYEKNYYDDNKKKLPIIKTSILKTSKVILQKKLKDFYNFLQTVIEWKKDINKIINRGYNDEKIWIKVGQSRVKIHSCDFEFVVINPDAKEKYNEEETIHASQIISYRRGSYQDDEGKIDNQELLLKILSNFEDWDKVLLKAEKTKAKLIKYGTNIVEEMKEYNKPARVLKKIIQSSI